MMIVPILSTLDCMKIKQRILILFKFDWLEQREQILRRSVPVLRLKRMVWYKYKKLGVDMDTMVRKMIYDYTLVWEPLAKRM